MLDDSETTIIRITTEAESNDANYDDLLFDAESVFTLYVSFFHLLLEKVLSRPLLTYISSLKERRLQVMQ